MTYELMKHDKNRARVRTYAARAAIAAGLALILAGFSFAGQSGIGLASRLADHQHTGAGDGAVLQGLAPVGNFIISGNNAGNIGISSSITGSNFIWKPASTTFLAGQATDDSFYVNNIGGYSWIGGYNTMSKGDYSLAFGTSVKNNRAASILLGYYLKNNAGNSVMIGSGPGFGGSAYAVNDDTGSIKFFPFTTTSETRPMLNLKRDNTAEAVGVWNFTSTPTLNGLELSTAVTVDNSKVLKTGDTMTGQLTLAASSFTIVNSSAMINSGTLKVRTRAAIQAHFYGYEPIVFGAGENEGSIMLGGGGNASGVGLRISHYSGGTGYTYFDNLQTGTSPGDTQFRSNNAANLNFSIGNNGAISAPGNIFTVGTSSFVVKYGLVGIGTTGPEQKLDVVGNIQAVTSGNRSINIDVSDTGTNYSVTSNGGSAGDVFRIGTLHNGPLSIYTNNTEKMTVLAGGNVGIGTTAPGAKLHAVGEIRASTSTTSGASICLAGAFDALPTTGYARGCLAYLTTEPTKIYIATETVVGVQSWLGK